MTNATPHEHDLEDHMATLRKLDEARKRSGKLRDQGIDVLRAHGKDLLRSRDKLWDASLAAKALGTKLNQPLEKEKDQEELLSTIFELGEYLQTLTLENIVDDKLSVMAAARVLRALVACPGAAFSKTAMVCYYWIARELYTAEGSDWNTGGVRAAPEGSVSAFVTGECVHALLSFAEAQKKTGIFIEEVGKFTARKEHLEKLEKKFDWLKGWVEVEKKRLNLSFSLTLQRLSRHLVIPIELPPEQLSEEIKRRFPKLDDFAKHYIAFSISKKDSESIDGEFDKFAEKFSTAHLKDVIEKAKGNFEEAKGEIDAYRIAERDKMENNKDHERPFKKSESAHWIALSAVETAGNSVTEAGNKFNDEQWLENCRKILNKAAEEVRYLLYPAENYLGTVLDRELSTVSLGGQEDWQPAELACAAAAYGRLHCLPAEWEKDPRFGRATDQLSKAVSRFGLMPNKRPYHIERTANRHYYFSNSAALTALAQLLRNLDKPEIEPDLIAKILEFFEETRATQPYEDWKFSKEEITPSLMNTLLGDSFSVTGLRECFELKPNIKNLNPRSMLDEKKITEAIRETLADFLNHCLEDDQLYDNEIFKNINDTNKYEVEKLVKEKNRHKVVCLNRRLLEYAYENILKSNAAKFSPDKEVKGWCREYLSIPRKTDLTATAHAVSALAEINEMLDERINNMILEHFTVKKKNKGLDENLTLDSLFYPDYGFRRAPKAIQWPDEIKKEDRPEKGCYRENSVAITLQQMCAHMSRVSLPDKFNPLCSLVLHGPAGTGKTTLVEALAVTCDVPLVEVTPSDLVKRGEENIEQRARAVFEALSMLTRSVILFDEFDPVLKRRDAANNNPLSVFSFLTPGMLPKLKDLHNWAEKRSVAYVLITNLIGELDEAAVRQGRFDERLGIYPPDLLSRTGRFLDQLSMETRGKWRKLEEGPALSGITVLGVLRLPTNEGGILSLTQTNPSADKYLSWKPFEQTKAAKVKVDKDGLHGLEGKNSDVTTAWLFVEINTDSLGVAVDDINLTFSEPDSESDAFGSNCLSWIRIVEIIRETGGKGMTALGKQGWFKYPKKIKEKTPFGYVLGMERFDDLEPDDKLKGIRGEGRTAVTECLQWMWIEAWDKKLFEENKENVAPDKHLFNTLEEDVSLEDWSKLKYVNSSDHWEVLGDGNPDKPHYFIRRLKREPVETGKHPSAQDNSSS